MDPKTHFPFSLYVATFGYEKDLPGTFLGSIGSIVLPPNFFPLTANEVQHVLMSITNASHSCPPALGDASDFFGIKD